MHPLLNPLHLIRLILLGIFFFSGAIAIVLNQFMFIIWHALTKSSPLQSQLEYTKKSFVVLLTFCTSNFTSHSTISLSFRDEELMKNCLSKNNDGELPLLKFDNSAIIISNHQIYSDWFFLWFLAYLNNTASHFFIVMKKSLENIPILGYGMKNYNFIFLSRNWQNDRLYMESQFRKILKVNEKFWMLIFPEGTNMSHNNRNKSHKFALESNLPVNNCVLLPRIKGLYVASKNLLNENSSKILDFTIGYTGNTKDIMAQDVHTLWKIYIEGISPKKISILVDEHELNAVVPDIFNNELNEDEQMKSLEKWIVKTWSTKEEDMANYYETGKFDVPETHTIEFPLRLHSNWEVVSVYGPTLAVLAVVIGVVKLM